MARAQFVASATETPDADTAALLAVFDAAGAPQLAQKSPAEVRAWMDGMVARYALDPKPAPAAIEDFEVPGEAGHAIPVRLYRPRPHGGVALPIMVFCHAGGYVFGDLETLDSFCRYMTVHARCLVLSVDYRRAPESRFPVPLEDCYAAALWAWENAVELGADPDRLILGGDSSGGTMATVICQLAKQRGKPAIAHQMLWYPGTGSAGPTESGERYGTGYFLENDLMGWSMKHYLPAGVGPADHRIQPILFDDMSGLPPVFLMTAGFDPRRDDNLAYAEKLAAAGVPVHFRCIESTIHGFLFMLGGISAAREAARESAEYLAGLFGGPR